MEKRGVKKKYQQGHGSDSQSFKGECEIIPGIQGFINKGADPGFILKFKTLIQCGHESGRGLDRPDLFHGFSVRNDEPEFFAAPVALFNMPHQKFVFLRIKPVVKI